MRFTPRDPVASSIVFLLSLILVSLHTKWNFSIVSMSFGPTLDALGTGVVEPQLSSSDEKCSEADFWTAKG